MSEQKSKGHLLIVEDDEDIAHVLCVALRIAGYQAQAAKGSIEAQQYLRDNEVDLVVTDWMLPDGNGADVCMAARSKNSQMPIIVISAVVGRWDMEVMKCQSDAYLKKPVDMTTLRATIERLLIWRHPKRQESEQSV